MALEEAHINLRKKSIEIKQKEEELNNEPNPLKREMLETEIIEKQVNTKNINNSITGAIRKMSYFTRVQPNQHHTNTPLNDTVGVYSFSLKPEEHQPSGTCNFSRIDNATLQLTHTAIQCDHARTLKLFAVNYNVLRIMSGMGGLAYSN